MFNTKTFGYWIILTVLWLPLLAFMFMTIPNTTAQVEVDWLAFPVSYLHIRIGLIVSCILSGLMVAFIVTSDADDYKDESLTKSLSSEAATIGAGELMDSGLFPGAGMAMDIFSTGMVKVLVRMAVIAFTAAVAALVAQVAADTTVVRIPHGMHIAVGVFAAMIVGVQLGDVLGLFSAGIGRVVLNVLAAINLWSLGTFIAVGMSFGLGFGGFMVLGFIGAFAGIVIGFIFFMIISRMIDVLARGFQYVTTPIATGIVTALVLQHFGNPAASSAGLMTAALSIKVEGGLAGVVNSVVSNSVIRALLLVGIGWWVWTLANG